MYLVGALALPLALAAQTAPTQQTPAPGTAATVTKEQAPPSQPPQILSQDEKEEILKDPTRMRRFYIGAKLGYNFFGAIKDGSASSSSFDTNPQTYHNEAGRGTKQPGSFGLWGEFRVYRRFFFVVEATQRKGGYNTSYQDISSVVNGATTVKVVYEGTRFRLYDFPVMVRWYNQGSKNGRYKFFLNGGGAIREVKHIRTIRDIYIDSNDVTHDYAQAVPNATRITGLCVGAGLRATDDFGIKIQPEIRYTRWNKKLFTAGGNPSRGDQLELSIGFTF